MRNTELALKVCEDVGSFASIRAHGAGFVAISFEPPLVLFWLDGHPYDWEVRHGYEPSNVIVSGHGLGALCRSLPALFAPRPVALLMPRSVVNAEPTTAA